MTILSSSKDNRNQQSAPLINNFIWPLIPIIAIAVGVILRMTIRTSTSLWEDEINAATHATQPILRLLINAFVNDIHPPLYFLELHFWSYFVHSDGWLITNSIALSLLAIVSIFYAVRRMTNTTQALIVAAVFSVLPVPIWMSEEVRMYSMLSVLLIWMYYFTHKAFALSENVTRSRAVVFILSVAIIYTHAIGFVAVFFYALYAASWLATRRAPRRDWLIWIFLFGCAGITALPVLIGSIIHKADMPEISGLRDIALWMASVVTGEGYKSSLWLQAMGLAAYLIAVFFGTYCIRTRRITLCFLIAPLLICAIVGITVRPLFKTNFFSNLYSPFLAIVIGEILISLPFKKVTRTVVLSCILAVLLTMAITNRTILNASNTYYHDIAEVITAEKQPGDVVWVPQLDIFWGMAWYLSGPDWGSPVAVNGPLRPQSHWWKVFDMLGPDLVKKLGLIPTFLSITTKDGLPIMISAASQPQAEQARRVWLVTYARDDLPAGLPPKKLGPLSRDRSLLFPPLQLDLYTSPASDPSR